MAKSEINSLPVLFTRGTHYQVGYNIGKAFGLLIKDFLNDLDFYNQISLPLFDLPEGRKVYDEVLNICNSQFPQYVKEIQGMADGAALPFHQLFILHVEHLMMANESELTSPKSDHGCTDIMCNNQNEVIIGHSEDAFPQCYGRTFIVQAEIVDENGKVVEQFASVAYPGYLPGYTMGFNEHGMMHSINTINPQHRNPKGTPREFIARALLGVKTIDEAVEILKNKGYGIADGFNLNIHFANQIGKVVYSIEVGPGQNGKEESQLDILEVPVGDSYFHCNRYLRLSIPNVPNFFSVSTDFRQETLKKYPKAGNINDVKTMLSDTSNSKWPVYRTAVGEDKGYTVMTGKYASIHSPVPLFMKLFNSSFCRFGIFDTSCKSWLIFTGPAATTNPVAVIKMNY